ncbi:MAG: DNA-binding protein [Clostridia bacterium]|nr:DNA-binding protein [Clostridia bacterium]
MFEKNMRLAYLLDFYVDVLDEHAQDVMRAYYEDDLSLAEIATGEGISRQGIRHIIKRCEEQITLLEEKLHLAERHAQTQKAIDTLRLLANAAEGGSATTREELERVIEILEKGV